MKLWIGPDSQLCLYHHGQVPQQQERTFVLHKEDSLCDCTPVRQSSTWEVCAAASGTYSTSAEEISPSCQGGQKVRNNQWGLPVTQAIKTQSTQHCNTENSHTITRKQRRTQPYTVRKLFILICRSPEKGARTLFCFSVVSDNAWASPSFKTQFPKSSSD